MMLLLAAYGILFPISKVGAATTSAIISTNQGSALASSPASALNTFNGTIAQISPVFSTFPNAFSSELGSTTASVSGLSSGVGTIRSITAATPVLTSVEAASTAAFSTTMPPTAVATLQVQVHDVAQNASDAALAYLEHPSKNNARAAKRSIDDALAEAAVLLSSSVSGELAVSAAALVTALQAAQAAAIDAVATPGAATAATLAKSMATVEQATKAEEADHQTAEPNSPSQSQSQEPSSAQPSSSAPCSGSATACSSTPTAVLRISPDGYANVQDVLDGEFIRSRMAALGIQKSASKAAPVASTKTSSAAKATLSTLDCHQKIPDGGPTGQQVSDALQANGAFDTICAAKFNGRSGNSTFKVFNHGSLNIELSRRSESIKLTHCMDGLNSIINVCILNENKYGGTYSQGGQTYEITNTEFPANPLVPGADAGAPAATQGAPAPAQSRQAPAPAVPAIPPMPTQVKSNNDGSGLCPSLAGACIFAFSGYNDTFLYTARTSYPATAGDADAVNFFFPEYADNGCAAIFTCDNDDAFRVGMTGRQIKDAFQFMFDHDHVTECGSSYLSNGCHITANGCDGCRAHIPCESLPPDAPEGFPCY